MSKPAYIEVIGTEGKNTASASPTKKFGKRLGNLENLTQAILWVGLISLVAVVITCCTLVVDQMHFNNQTYRDQSEKTQLQIEELNARIDALNKK